MAKVATIRLGRIDGEIAGVFCDPKRAQFSTVCPVTSWTPPINAFRCKEGILVCIDLAGVDRSQFEIHLEPRRIMIRGYRATPEPDRRKHQSLRVLAMEIDYGMFQREMSLPLEIDAEQTIVEPHDGLFWITLPKLNTELPDTSEMKT